MFGAGRMYSLSLFLRSLSHRMRSPLLHEQHTRKHARARAHTHTHTHHLSRALTNILFFLKKFKNSFLQTTPLLERCARHT